VSTPETPPPALTVPALDLINNDLRVRLFAGQFKDTQARAKVILDEANAKYGGEIERNILADVRPDLLRPLARTAVILGEALTGRESYQEAQVMYRGAARLNAQRPDSFARELSIVTILCAAGRSYGLWGETEHALFALDMAINGAKEAAKLSTPEHAVVGDTSKNQSLRAAHALAQSILEITCSYNDGCRVKNYETPGLLEAHIDLQHVVDQTQTPIDDLRPGLNIVESLLGSVRPAAKMLTRKWIQNIVTDRRPLSDRRFHELLGNMPSSVAIDWPNDPNSEF
jgi:hypothetical protein